MIHCNDLRTGNIILVNKRLRRVISINSSQTLTDQSLIGVESMNYEEKENYPAEEVYPVPMNEALLEQCHFSYRENFKFWQLICTDGMRTEMNVDPDYNFIDFMRRPVVKSISSLHQLQNIYYMLFSKELEFDVETTVVVDGIIRNGLSRN